MSDVSLVPVEYPPDFENVSNVPVDHDPFSGDGVTQQAQAQIQAVQSEPQGQPQQPSIGVDQSNSEVPADQSMPLTNRSSHSVPGDSYPTADAAAVAALQNINPTSQHYGLEYAGAHLSQMARPWRLFIHAAK